MTSNLADRLSPEQSLLSLRRGGVLLPGSQTNTVARKTPAEVAAGADIDIDIDIDINIDIGFLKCRPDRRCSRC
jgi:hypothetical protein